jgi:hypothetical protein
LGSYELVEKLADTYESEMSDTDESSECEFHGKDDMLLPDSDESVHVSDNDFLWKVMDTYSGLREFLLDRLDLKIVQRVRLMLFIFIFNVSSRDLCT